MRFNLIRIQNPESIFKLRDQSDEAEGDGEKPKEEG